MIHNNLEPHINNLDKLNPVTSTSETLQTLNQLYLFLTWRQAHSCFCLFVFGLLQCTLYMPQSIHIGPALVAAPRVLTKANRSTHITQIVSFLHWLPIKFRIDFKTLLIVFKAQHGLAHYITELLTPYPPSRNLRSSDLACCTKVKAGD